MLLALPTLMGLLAQDVPHNQDAPPNAPRGPEEALEHFTLPEGFRLELVAAEPDVINPVAMAFDGAGRLWITESVEYPRKPAGVGRDRVKVLSDPDGDGRFDRVEVFAEGLNIPSGVEVTPDAVLVANAPDILRWDRRAPELGPTAILTGFGRDDTHELPNSLTLGPDGLLYGLNGVFNFSRVEGLDFTCAAWRCDTAGEGFELFAEGTSNPWGIAFDPYGSLFVSACVIDHLWHLAQDVDYHRQAGAYRPYTWKAGSIVDHRHQKAAYCGIHHLDSARYPAPYRDVLVMGNIHGGCVNVDRVERRGASYHGAPLPDLLTANDAWFMPVAQLEGPDGFLYVLDWYDRYHCYQDANRDPEGIDRGRGRIWRVVHEDAPFEPWREDLATASEERLLEHLASPFGGRRRLARLELASRLSRDQAPALQGRLEELALSRDLPTGARLEALFTVATGTGAPSTAAHLQLLKDADAEVRAWAARLAPRASTGSGGPLPLQTLAADPDPRVLLQVATAAPRMGTGFDDVSTLTRVLDNPAADELVARVAWRHLRGRLEAALDRPWQSTPAWDALLPHAIAKLLADGAQERIGAVLTQLDGEPAAEALAAVREQVQSGEARGADLRTALEPALARHLAGKPGEARTLEAALLAAAWGDPRGLAAARTILVGTEPGRDRRLAALEALVAAQAPGLLLDVGALLSYPAASTGLRGELVAALGRLDDPRVGEVALGAWPNLSPAERTRVVTLCLQRASWARSLLARMPEPVSPQVLNASQARRLAAFEDPELDALLDARWGRVRDGRDPDREAVIDRARILARRGGDAHAGREVFARICGTCHKLHGEGASVGPDLTGNGRGDLEQLLSNVFDPALVVGADYRQQVVRTTDGRVLGGLLVEDSDARVVLRVEGGRDEVIPREDIDVSRATDTSLMPEGFEAQLSEDELANLLAYLVREGPLDGSDARTIPGVVVEEVETSDPDRFDDLLAQAAPGFTCAASGNGGVALLPELEGRRVVVRTHPLSGSEPCLLDGRFQLPADRSSSLELAVARHPRGDWRLVVRAGDEVLLDTPVDEDTAPDGWLERSLDLTPWAGQVVDLRLENHATGWFYEYGYWGRVTVLSAE